MLLARHVHAPVLDGCDSCHEGASDALAEGGGAELCAQCHPEIPEAAAQAAVPHAAMEMGSCTPCHDPHAAPRARLVKAPAAGCGECHADQVAGAGEVPHGVIDLLGCEACHEPHGGSKAKLLRAEGAELCLSCHADGVVKAATDGALRVFDRFALPTAGLSVVVGSPAAVDNHPVTGHRALGQPTPEELKRTASTHTGPLTCTTCHDPHKGRSAGLLAWGAASPTEACQRCHAK